MRKQQAPLKQIEAENAKKQAETKKLEEVARLKLEVIEKKKQYAKVEIRGKLMKSNLILNWQVAINDLIWTLNFNNNKELLAFAEKNTGKAVVITGTIVNKKSAAQGSNPGPYPQFPQTYMTYPVETPVTVNVESLKLAEN